VCRIILIAENGKSHFWPTCLTIYDPCSKPTVATTGHNRSYIVSAVLRVKKLSPSLLQLCLQCPASSHVLLHQQMKVTNFSLLSTTLYGNFLPSICVWNKHWRNAAIVNCWTSTSNTVSCLLMVPNINPTYVVLCCTSLQTLAITDTGGKWLFTFYSRMWPSSACSPCGYQTYSPWW